MHIIKRLDLFILKAFLQLFAATFFVCLFVFMMQYTWRYIDELIGKGLSVDVLAKFFWYMALNFVPAALPPAFCWPRSSPSETWAKSWSCFR